MLEIGMLRPTPAVLFLPFVFGNLSGLFILTITLSGPERIKRHRSPNQGSDDVLTTNSSFRLPEVG